jgi:hypothetical protein
MQCRYPSHLTICFQHALCYLLHYYILHYIIVLFITALLKLTHGVWAVMLMLMLFWSFMQYIYIYIYICIFIYLFIYLFIPFSVCNDGEERSFSINCYSLSTLHSFDSLPIPIRIH